MAALSTYQFVLRPLISVDNCTSLRAWGDPGSCWSMMGRWATPPAEVLYCHQCTLKARAGVWQMFWASVQIMNHEWNLLSVVRKCVFVVHVLRQRTRVWTSLLAQFVWQIWQKETMELFPSHLVMKAQTISSRWQLMVRTLSYTVNWNALFHQKKNTWK